MSSNTVTPNAAKLLHDLRGASLDADRYARELVALLGGNPPSELLDDPEAGWKLQRIRGSLTCLSVSVEAASLRARRDPPA